MIGNDDARTRLSHFDLSFMRVGERILDEVRHHSAQKKRRKAPRTAVCLAKNKLAASLCGLWDP